MINEESLARKLSDLNYQQHCTQVAAAFAMKDYAQVIRLLGPHLQLSISSQEEHARLHALRDDDEQQPSFKRETFNLPFHVHIQMLDLLQQSYLRMGDITASLKCCQVLLRDAITDINNTLGVVCNRRAFSFALR